MTAIYVFYSLCLCCYRCHCTSAIVVGFACFAFNVFFFSLLFSCNVNIVIEKLNEPKREPLNTQSIFRFDRGFFSALLYIYTHESFIDIIHTHTHTKYASDSKFKKKPKSDQQRCFHIEYCKTERGKWCFFFQKKNRNRLM